MIDYQAMMRLGVQGFFVALGFALCAAAAYCLLSLAAGVLSGIFKRQCVHRNKEE